MYLDSVCERAGRVASDSHTQRQVNAGQNTTGQQQGCIHFICPITDDSNDICEQHSRHLRATHFNRTTALSTDISTSMAAQTFCPVRRRLTTHRPKERPSVIRCSLSIHGPLLQISILYLAPCCVLEQLFSACIAFVTVVNAPVPIAYACVPPALVCRVSAGACACVQARIAQVSQICTRALVRGRTMS